ncbi:MAG: hypothetical protein HZA24_06070 [Nitrospirae bacterium]|nr:hypothetical protein [Nitrospirota bacterium]
MSRLDVIPPPPGDTGTALFRWLTDVRRVVGLETLRSVAFQGAWVNFGAPYQEAGYWVRGGEVRLTGVVKGGAVNSAIFMLPAGFRPAAQTVFNQRCASGTARVDVRADGQVYLNDAGADTAWLSLDGIIFRIGG